MQETPRHSDLSRQIKSDEIDLIALLLPLYRHIKLIVLVPIIGALLFGVLYHTLFPRRYMSSADLVVTQPLIDTELQDRSENVQFYRTLVESPALLAKVEILLVQKKVLEPGARLELGEQIQVQIFTKRRAEEVSLAPLIRLKAFGSSPDDALTTLNLWLEEVKQTFRSLDQRARSEAISFVEEEFPKQKHALENTSKQLAAIRLDYMKQINALEQKQKEELDKIDADIMNGLNAFDVERAGKRIELVFDRKQARRQLVLEQKQERNELVRKLEPEINNAEYRALMEKYASFRADLKTIDVEIGSEKEIVEGLEGQLSETSRVTITRKDRFLFDTKEEVLNPSYEKLEASLMEHRLSLSNLKSKKENILSHLEQLAEQFDKLRATVNNNEKELQNFDQETENRLNSFDDQTAMLIDQFDQETRLKRKKLNDALELKRKKLADSYSEQISDMKGTQELSIQLEEQQMTYMENVYKSLAEKYEQVRLAKSGDQLSLKVATMSYRPEHALPRGTVKKTMVAGLLLAFLCLCYVYGRELILQLRSRPREFRS